MATYNIVEACGHQITNYDKCKGKNIEGDGGTIVWDKEESRSKKANKQNVKNDFSHCCWCHEINVLWKQLKVNCLLLTQAIISLHLHNLQSDQLFTLKYLVSSRRKLTRVSSIDRIRCLQGRLSLIRKASSSTCINTM